MARPKIVAMIPARLGSERIPRKNLAPMGNTTLLGNAIRIAQRVKLYDEVWVNTADDRLAEEAERCGAEVHRRSPALSDGSDSMSFKLEFTTMHQAEFVVNHNPTAPLLTPGTCTAFCEKLLSDGYDVLHTIRRHQAYMLDQDFLPINFDDNEHPRTQDLPPVYEVCWAVFGWQREAFLRAECGVWQGRVGFFELSDLEATQVRHGPLELEVAQYLFAKHRDILCA